MRRLRVPVMALLATLVVLLAAGASARKQYFCHMMGRVVDSCCCTEGYDAPAIECETAQVRTPDCCERIDSGSRSTLPGTPDRIARVVPSAALAVVVLAAPEPTLPHPDPATPPSPEARAPPAVGPPRFLAHCAFLI